eukprot:4900391-Amphidinium_carterae.1
MSLQTVGPARRGHHLGRGDFRGQCPGLLVSSTCFAVAPTVCYVGVSSSIPNGCVVQSSGLVPRFERNATGGPQ